MAEEELVEQTGNIKKKQEHWTTFAKHNLDNVAVVDFFGIFDNKNRKCVYYLGIVCKI